MAQEIERKFLVVGPYKDFSPSHYTIRQGYICSGGGRTVRVRLCGERGFLTIKGPSLDGGLSRFEFEKEITENEASQTESTPSKLTSFWAKMKASLLQKSSYIRPMILISSLISWVKK